MGVDVNNAYECTVLMKDGSRVIVVGADNVHRSRSGQLELFTESIVSREVPESWFWGIYRTTRTEKETITETIAMFADGAWQCFWANNRVTENPSEH